MKRFLNPFLKLTDSEIVNAESIDRFINNDQHQIYQNLGEDPEKID
jgi:hypothetical protein